MPVPATVPPHDASGAGRATGTRPIRRTDPAILWCLVVIVTALTAIRMFGQLRSKIADAARALPAAADIDDPALMDLAVNAGVVLAGVVALFILVLYLSLCAKIDEVLLPGLMRRSSRRRGRDGRIRSIGPALLVGALAHVPVQVVALATAAPSPKDSPLALAWVAVVVIAVAVLALTGRAVPPRRRAVVVGILVGVAALSLLL